MNPVPPTHAYPKYGTASTSTLPRKAPRSSAALISVTTASLGTLLGLLRCLVYCANQAAPAPTAAPTAMPCQPNGMVAAPATAPMTRRYGMISRSCSRSSLEILSNVDSKIASTTKMPITSQWFSQENEELVSMPQSK